MMPPNCVSKELFIKSDGPDFLDLIVLRVMGNENNVKRKWPAGFYLRAI